MSTSKTYTLDGPKDFTFPFPVRTADQITVSITPGGVLPSSEYQVIGASATASSVTIRYPNAPTDGTKSLIIQRRTDPQRVSTFLNDLSITATALNAEFDNVLQLVQDGILNEYKGVWGTGELFLVLDVVEGPDGNIYISREQHESDVFADDLAAGKWGLAADFATGQQSIDAAVDDAEAARDKAEDSETAAASSAAAAKISEDNAAASELNASNSASAASTSEQNAATSAQNASNSASAAATSEQNAANSATAASNSATAASNSASAAATSEQNAEDSADAALQSEQNAEPVNAIVSEIETVAGISLDVSIVAGIDSDIVTVSDNAESVSAVAANIFNVNQVALGKFVNKDWNDYYTENKPSLNLGGLPVTGAFFDEKVPGTRMSLALGASTIDLGGLI